MRQLFIPQNIFRKCPNRNWFLFGNKRIMKSFPCKFQYTLSTTPQLPHPIGFINGILSRNSSPSSINGLKKVLIEMNPWKFLKWINKHRQNIVYFGSVFDIKNNVFDVNSIIILFFYVIWISIFKLNIKIERLKMRSKSNPMDRGRLTSETN